MKNLKSSEIKGVSGGDLTDVQICQSTYEILELSKVLTKLICKEDPNSVECYSLKSDFFVLVQEHNAVCPNNFIV